MAVSKRTRFEVFRRDDFTCRYCRSKDNPLTIDHVVPTTLGGSDDPDNLVTACRDCNAGKSSTSPDEATVADVADDAMRWAKAMRAAADYAASDAEADHGIRNPSPRHRGAAVIETTPTGIEIIDCAECGRHHPATRSHCPVCGRASLFGHEHEEVRDA